jgi:hypothetical protein
MHPPMNVLVNFNDIIEKNIKLKGLLKNVILIIPISMNFQYHHHILESNTSKTINRHQLPLPLSFCFTYFKTQGQTFDNLIINILQPPNNVHLNIYA